MSRPPTRGKRFLKLAGMTASVASGYAATKLKGIFQNPEERRAERERSNREAGGRIAKTLGELRGAVMKVGQMASIAADVLPRELSDALGQLQKEAPPMKFEVIAEQIEKELGSPPHLLFDWFDEEPFAAASIGQVHRARTDDGRNVVVKVQYPGVDGAVDSDLAQLKLALRASGIVDIGREALNASFREMKARLHEELDYTNEAENVRAFKRFHECAGHDYLVIPDVVGERSSQRVLTLTFEPGDHLDHLDELDYDQDVRNLLGERLFHTMCSQIFEFGRIHADPNPGNFAFRKTGQIVLYDFGCVKDLDPSILAAYRDTIQAGLVEDYAAVDDALTRLGARRQSGPPVEDAFYKMWRDAFAEPFLRHEMFDYGKTRMHEAVVRLFPASIKKVSSFQPATEVIFLDRMVVGHYGNLRQLRARIPSFKLLEPYLRAYDPEALASRSGSYVASAES